MASAQRDGSAVLPFVTPRPRLERRADGSLLFWQDRQTAPAWRSLAHLFVARAMALPDRVLLAQRVGEGWKTISYGEMLSRARRVAAGLLACGLAPGDRILVLSYESIDHAALLFGAMMSSIVLVPLSVGYSLSGDLGRLDHLVRLIEAKMVFAEDARLFGPALVLAGSAGAARLVSGDGDDGLGRLETMAVPVDVMTSLDSITPDTVFKILLTSGSTALPRAVIQTHRMSCASLAFEEALSSMPPCPREPHVVLDWLPWSHVGGAITTLNNVLLAGASLYLDDGKPVPGRFDPTIRNLKEFPPEVFASPPAGCAMLVQAMDDDIALRSLFFSRLRYVKSGAAGMPESVRRAFQRYSVAQTGHTTPILMGYGTTETHGVISVTWDTERPFLLGHPKPGVVLKLVPFEDRFELRVKSDSVTPGYFRDPEATAAAMDEEGFFRTGDSAVLDPDDLSEGLIFAGRLGENFKMATGTWVPAGDLRAAVLDALDGRADDALVLGEGRAHLTLMLWAPDDPARRRAICAAVRRFNASASGASRRIARIVFSSCPISADRFERTEKGTLNRGAIIAHRRDEVDRLYAEPFVPDDHVIDLTTGLPV